MSKPVVFYDIPGNINLKKAWSPNTQKTRYSLNYKGVPYKTVWVEYPDIASLAKKIGAKPTDVKDGKPYYTVPIIYDPNTDTVVSDSLDIAQYLDRQYPGKPALVPAGTAAFQALFISTFMKDQRPPLFQLIVLQTCAQLNPHSAGYFRRTRELWLSAKLEEICPAGPKRTSMLDTMKSKFDALDKILETNGEGKLFVMGDTLSFADLQIASFLFFFKLMVEEQEWEEVAGWNDGRWRKLMEALKQYEEGVGDESEAWKPE